MSKRLLFWLAARHTYGPREQKEKGSESRSELKLSETPMHKISGIVKHMQKAFLNLNKDNTIDNVCVDEKVAPYAGKMPNRYFNDSKAHDRGAKMYPSTSVSNW